MSPNTRPTPVKEYVDAGYLLNEAPREKKIHHRCSSDG